MVDNKLNILLVIISLFFHLQVFGSDDVFFTKLKGESLFSDSTTAQHFKSDWQPTTSVYFELGGRLALSLNVDFRKRENIALSIGNSFWFDNEEHKQMLIIPFVMGYYLSGERHRLEIGGGTGTLITTYKGLAGLMFFGNFGYRYQKKKGLIFRAGFTPFMSIPIAGKSKYWVTPWAGISLGYSF